MSNLHVSAPITVEEIVAAWLRANGYDGLYDPDEDCGCSVDDLNECEGGWHCLPGMKRSDGQIWPIGPEEPNLRGELLEAVAMSTRLTRKLVEISDVLESLNGETTIDAARRVMTTVVNRRTRPGLVITEEGE